MEQKSTSKVMIPRDWLSHSLTSAESSLHGSTSVASILGESSKAHGKRPIAKLDWASECPSDWLSLSLSLSHTNLATASGESLKAHAESPNAKFDLSSAEGSSASPTEISTQPPILNLLPLCDLTDDAANTDPQRPFYDFLNVRPPPNFDNHAPLAALPLHVPIHLPPQPQLPRDAPVGRKRRPALPSETILQPYPWATNSRAIVQSIDRLNSQGIVNISGRLECRSCDKQFEVAYDLNENFRKIASFIRRRSLAMYHRAPNNWVNPVFPDCQLCGMKKCARPVMGKKRNINWLFLLFGNMLGFCKLSELKYFCKHTGNHRTGAKNRLLFLTYMGLCKQLDPNGPYAIVV